MAADASGLSEAPDWAIEMLRDARVGRLGTASPDGEPHVVPVCFVLDAGACYTPIDGKPKRGPRLRRLINLAANPRAALIVDHYDEDWRHLRYVMVHGTAGALRDPRELERTTALLIAKYPQYLETPPISAEGPMVIQLIIERLTCWRWHEGSV